MTLKLFFFQEREERRKMAPEDRQRIKEEKKIEKKTIVSTEHMNNRYFGFGISNGLEIIYI